MEQPVKKQRDFRLLYDAVECINTAYGNWGDIMDIEIDDSGFVRVKFEATVIGEP